MRETETDQRDEDPPSCRTQDDDRRGRDPAQRTAAPSLVDSDGRLSRRETASASSLVAAGRLWNRAASLLTGFRRRRHRVACDITDTSSRRPLAAPAAPTNGAAGRRPGCPVVRSGIKTRGGRVNVANVVATLVPMRCEKAYAFCTWHPGWRPGARARRRARACPSR